LIYIHCTQRLEESLLGRSTTILGDSYILMYGTKELVGVKPVGKRKILFGIKMSLLVTSSG
jgi:hypothetical protein